MRSRILTIEDDLQFQETYRHVLSDCLLTIVPSIAEGRSQVFQNQFDLILLDLVLPDGNGNQLLFDVSKYAPNSSVLVISSKAEASDAIVSLTSGALDYIRKPFDIFELKAKIFSHLRRKESPKELALEKDGFLLNQESYSLSFFDSSQKFQSLSLSPINFRLLWVLAKRKDRVFSREELISRVWTENISVIDRVVDVHISTLRKILKKTSYDIVASYGAGYRLVLKSHRL